MKVFDLPGERVLRAQQVIATVKQLSVNDAFALGSRTRRFMSSEFFE